MAKSLETAKSNFCRNRQALLLLLPRTGRGRSYAPALYRLTTSRTRRRDKPLAISNIIAMLLPWSPSQQSGLRDDLILRYFRGGHKYRTILLFLLNIHNINLSMRQLKRVLKRLGSEETKCKDSSKFKTC